MENFQNDSSVLAVFQKRTEKIIISNQELSFSNTFQLEVGLVRDAYFQHGLFFPSKLTKISSF